MSDEPDMRWETCAHRFVPYFGPVLHCRLCGASTMVSMDPKESKPIFPPTHYLEDEYQRGNHE